MLCGSQCGVMDFTQSLIGAEDITTKKIESLAVEFMIYRISFRQSIYTGDRTQLYRTCTVYHTLRAYSTGSQDEARKLNC